MNKIKYLLLKGKTYYIVFIGFFRKGPLLNYCIENNAGDSYNKNFVFDYYRSKVRLYAGGSREHILFCGSILGRSNHKSIILGAGFISQEQSDKVINYFKIIGVRGSLTADKLLSRDSSISFVFKGDPGLLVQELIPPRKENYIPTGVIGVIPHFIDYDIVFDIVNNNKKYRLIDIRKDYKEVCEAILSCDKIISSSLHGLVFSDAMNVPNAWVSFSDNLIGGSFKFNDYYSVMTNPQSKVYFCKNILDIDNAQNNVLVSKNLGYKEMYAAVTNVFSEFSH